MKTFYLLVITFTLSACTGLGQIEHVYSLDRYQLQALREVKVIYDTIGVSYFPVAEIKGISCEQFLHTSSKDDAIEQLKIKAVKLDANGVLDPECSYRFIDLRNNCNESWVCFGEAIVIK